MEFFVSTSHNNKDLFTKINTDIMNSLIMSNLRGADIKIVLLLLNNTDPIDRIKEITISEMTNKVNLGYDAVRRVITKLERKRIITKKNNTFTINDPENWDI